MKFGVLQFPGSCDEVDALQAARRVGDAELIWHGERDLKGADAIVVPGGFSYGDYLRAGAIARFSPAMESVIAFARRRRAGARASATAFRCCARRACCPARCSVNANLRFTSRQVELEVLQQRRRRSPRACALGERLSIPAKHAWGRYYADAETLAAMDRAGQIVLRYAPGENFNGSLHDIAGVCNEARQRVRPDAPPRARRRRADGRLRPTG